MRIPYEAPAALGRKFIALAPDVAAAILTTLAAGWEYASAHSDVSAQTGEVAITERLRDGMRCELKKKNHPWGKALIILPGTESRSDVATLLPDGRTDIPIVILEVFLRTQEHDPHAVIECKRISGSDTHLCREYVIEGMDRFRTGKYANNHALGFMVGYTISGTAETAVAGVNAYLDGRSRSAESLRFSTLAEAITSWESQHARSSASPPIRLHHVFFMLPMASA